MKPPLELWWRGPAKESFSVLARFGEDREVLLMIPADHLQLLEDEVRRLRAAQAGEYQAACAQGHSVACLTEGECRWCGEVEKLQTIIDGIGDTLRLARVVDGTHQRWTYEHDWSGISTGFRALVWEYAELVVAHREQTDWIEERRQRIEPEEIEAARQIVQAQADEIGKLRAEVDRLRSSEHRRKAAENLAASLRVEVDRLAAALDEARSRIVRVTPSTFDSAGTIPSGSLLGVVGHLTPIQQRVAEVGEGFIEKMEEDES